MAESSSASARLSSSASLIGHETRGVGYASRFRVSKDNLPPGWRAEKKSSKCTVWFDEKGNYYRLRMIANLSSVTSLSLCCCAHLLEGRVELCESTLQRT